MDKCELHHELKENSMRTTRSSTKGNKYSYSNPKIKSNKDQSARVTGFQNPKDKKAQSREEIRKIDKFLHQPIRKQHEASSNC